MVNGRDFSIGRYDRTFVCELYRIFFDREPDAAGFEHHFQMLRTGTRPHELVQAFLQSEEFSQRTLRPTVDLPDLRKTYPHDYADDVYLAIDDKRIDRMEQLIHTCGYYDNFGVWSCAIDLDKLNMARLVEATGAKSCLEVGCFNGAILSVLSDRGIDVTGIELSHLAFVLAFANIRNRIIYGDLLSVGLHQKYECILLLDVLEHLNPLRLTLYISRLKELLNPDGVIILNSPMFGPDPMFGTVFEQTLPQWNELGDRGFFRHWPCDSKGWPMHGHMIWASPAWWTSQFLAHDLVRVAEVEATIQSELSGHFSSAPARKSMFCLAKRGAPVRAEQIASGIRSAVWQ